MPQKRVGSADVVPVAGCLVVEYNARLTSIGSDDAGSNAGIAQLVERNLAKVEVGSSNLLSRSRSPGKTVERNQPFSPFSYSGAVAKRLCRGLQILVGRFDSAPRLQHAA